MENLLYNLDSAESSYGDNLLTAVIQVDERISSIDAFAEEVNLRTDFDRTEIKERIDKIIRLNKNVQMELERQVQKLEHVKRQVGSISEDFDPQSRYLVTYKD
jgi:hypothetical protein